MGKSFTNWLNITVLRTWPSAFKSSHGTTAIYVRQRPPRNPIELHRCRRTSLQVTVNSEYSQSHRGTNGISAAHAVAALTWELSQIRPKSRASRDGTRGA